VKLSEALKPEIKKTQKGFTGGVGTGGRRGPTRSAPTYGVFINGKQVAGIYKIGDGMFSYYTITDMDGKTLQKRQLTKLGDAKKEVDKIDWSKV
jgi:hypothetical protein